MIDIYALARPALFQINPEAAHNTMLSAMKRGLLPSPCSLIEDQALETEVMGLKFPSPIGLAAGFDKNAEVVGSSFKLGFGFVEAGTVTPKPQNGNPRPRIFRDPQNEAVINRMGFPNGGMHAFKANLEKFLEKKPRPKGIVGLNIGMNKDQSEPVKDYATLIKMLAPMADYLTVNISSPNTPGLRDLQSRDVLMEMIATLHEERKKACGEHVPPLLVKFAPDLPEDKQDELAKTAIDSGIDGLILTNTTLERPDYLPEDFRGEAGGLSGKPLTDLSTQIVHNFYALTNGKIPIIGVGGISTGQDAYDKICAGASLVQVYSGMVYRGPAIANYIAGELLDILKREGFHHVSEAVGSAHKKQNKKSAKKKKA